MKVTKRVSNAIKRARGKDVRHDLRYVNPPTLVTWKEIGTVGFTAYAPDIQTGDLVNLGMLTGFPTVSTWYKVTMCAYDPVVPEKCTGMARFDPVFQVGS